MGLRTAGLRKILIPSNLFITFIASFYWRMHVLYPLDKYLGGLILLSSITAAVTIHGSYPDRHDSPYDFSDLLTVGPYSLCRHPFYLSLMGVQVGISLYMDSALGLASFVLTLPAWYLLMVREERELLMRWGERYREYMRRTPMILPKLRRNQSPQAS